MSKPGPTPDPAKRRRHRFNLYFNDEELDLLEARLASPGLAATVRAKGTGARRGQKQASTGMRGLVLGTGRPVPELNLVAYRELLRVGQDVNVIAKSEWILKPNKEMIEAILGDLATLRKKLIAVQVKLHEPEVDPLDHTFHGLGGHSGFEGNLFP